MSKEGMNYKQDSISFATPVAVIVLLALIWLGLLLLGKKGKLEFLKGSKSDALNKGMQVESSLVLPRGGLLVKTKIDNKYVFFLESNKHFQQVDLDKGIDCIPEENRDDS